MTRTVKETERMRSLKLPSVATAVMVLVLGVAEAKKPQPCPDGRFIVTQGSPVITGITAPGPEVVVLRGGQVSLETGCLAAPAKVKPLRNGTHIQSKWDSCGSLSKVKLVATIEAAQCNGLKGRRTAKRQKLLKFTAVRSRCGDGRLDPGLGEECDEGSLCGASERCEACLCVPLSPVTTTTTSSTSSTSTSSSSTTSTSTSSTSTTTSNTSTTTSNTSTTTSNTSATTSSTSTSSTTTSTSSTTTSSTPMQHCGNGILESTEECDDGNEDNTDSCTNACKNARCGDGIAQTGVEQCDDGNDVPNDGCTNCVLDPPRCGNGLVEAGETCDDGNTVDGDPCPANCRIEPCTATATRVNVRISFARPNGVTVGALTVFLDYPDGRISIPGAGNEAPVVGRISNKPANFSSAPFDLDYALRETIAAFNRTLNPGALFDVGFDLCDGAVAPKKGDFTCTVEQASTPLGVNLPLTGITCAVTLL